MKQSHIAILTGGSLKSRNQMLELFDQWLSVIFCMQITVLKSKYPMQPLLIRNFTMLFNYH